MTPLIRKFMLTLHVAFSVGWLGAVTGVLTLGIAGLTGKDDQTIHSVYLGTELIWRFVILPLSFAALLTGLIQALGTTWGLFRYYWVLVKFLLTIGSIIVLLMHTNTLLLEVSQLSGMTTKKLPSTRDEIVSMPTQIHLIVACSATILVLFIVITLSIFKPWGKTRYGQRKPNENNIINLKN
jgi:hypothetical protein